MFDFWVALGNRLWKEKDGLIPSGGTPEERSNATAMLNRILDRLLATAIPEYDYRVNYEPNVYSYSSGRAHDQSRTLKLLDLIALTHRVQHSTQLITLVSRSHEHLLVKYDRFIIPLIPGLKDRLLKYSAIVSPVLVGFLRTLVERYLQDLLGSPSKQPEAMIKKVNCRCGDCMMVNRFLRSDAVTEMFRVGEGRRVHIQGQLQTAVQGGFTFDTIRRGSPHTLQVTKRQDVFVSGKWNTRVQKARNFLAIVGTPDQLVRIMGERYPDVQAALAGTKPFVMGTLALTAPPHGGATVATTSTAGATTSGTRAGPVVAGVKRKAEDEDDVIDLTSD